MNIGSIDRLVLMYDSDTLVAADIIDFKSDTIDLNDAEQLSNKVEYYRPQLESYRAAIAQLYGLSPKQISARLVFVGSGLVTNV